MSSEARKFIERLKEEFRVLEHPMQEWSTYQVIDLIEDTHQREVTLELFTNEWFLVSSDNNTDVTYGHSYRSVEEAIVFLDFILRKN